MSELFSADGKILPQSALHSFTKWRGLREYVSGAKFSHVLVWPLELGLRTPTLQCGHLSGLSRTRGGFLDFEVGGYDGSYM